MKFVEVLKKLFMRNIPLKLLALAVAAGIVVVVHAAGL